MDWKVILTAFGLLFVAELGDKTQLAVFTLAAQTRSPFSVFTGASIALVVVTFLGAYLGQLVTRVIPASYVQLIAGILFVGIGVLVLWRAIADILG